MSEESDKLLSEGLAFIKAGQRAKAVDVLKKAVEEDSENVAIWVALAQALDDVDEKRIALTTILQLDPENEFAKGDLIETEKPKKAVADDSEIVPGIKQREARLAGIGLAVFTLVVCGITLSFVNGQNGARANNRLSLTQAALDGTALVNNNIATKTQEALVIATQNMDGTATQLSRTTATPTTTPTSSRILPTAIPSTPTPTEVNLRVAPPPPANLSGHIIAWGGKNPQSTDFLEFLSYPVGGGDPTRLNTDLVQSPTVDEAYSRVVYLRLISGGGTLFTVDPNNANPQGGADLLNVLSAAGGQSPQRPRLSRIGDKLVVIAKNGATDAVFVYSFANNIFRRVTPEDGANYSWATLSPDSTQVIAVKQTTNGTDLVLININDEQNGFPQTALTNDGDSLIESAPSYSADGVFVVYSGTTSNPNDADIYLSRLSGTSINATQVLISTTANETTPFFSPDGTYVAYLSSADGISNIFMFDIANKQTYQFTVETRPVFLGGWAR